MSRLLARRGYAQELTSNQCREVWMQTAGLEWVAHSRPTRLCCGVLEVAVRNSTVLHELSFRKKEILARICAHMPENTVQDVRFRVGEVD